MSKLGHLGVSLSKQDCEIKIINGISIQTN